MYDPAYGDYQTNKVPQPVFQALRNQSKRVLQRW